MTFLIYGKELGIPIAEIKVDKAEDIQILDDRFVCEKVNTIEAEETIRIISE